MPALILPDHKWLLFWVLCWWLERPCLAQLKQNALSIVTLLWHSPSHGAKTYTAVT